MAAQEERFGASWSEEIYEQRVPEIVEETNSRHCCLTEWVEQPMPMRDSDVRQTLRKSAPFFDDELIQAIPKENVAESGPLDLLVFGDQVGVMAEACARLKDRKQLGRSTKTVSLWENRDVLSPELISSYVASGPYDVIVFAASLDGDSNDADDVVAWTDVLVKAYLYLGQALLKDPQYCKKGLVTVTADAFSHETDVHRALGVKVCSGGFLFGASNTMRIEIPTVPIHYVDISADVDASIISCLASEITRSIGFGENAVKISAKARYVARAVLAEPKYATNATFRTPTAGVIAIGGGNGALGLVMGKYLLEKLLPDQEEDASSSDDSTLSIEFLSRSTRVSGEQNEKAWEDVQALAKKKNVAVAQSRCDVSSAEAIHEFCEKHGANLVGFVHSAGVLRDALLVNQTVENYDDVYKPKAYAAVYLHDALTKHCPELQFLWMFSSVAVYGNAGQSNYSGANAFLDTLSRHRKALGLPSTVIQWAGWGEVGMASQLQGVAKKRMEESPMPLFTNKQGLHGMEVGISTGLPVFCVLRFNAQAFLDVHNKDDKKTHESYSARFWGNAAPKKDLDELDLYEAVVNLYDQPRELQYDHFIDDLDDPFDCPLPKHIMPKVAQ